MNAGYSGTPLAQKLGIREGHTLVLLGAPDGLQLDLPPGVTTRVQARGTADVVVYFTKERRALEQRLDALVKVLDVDGGLWVCWPKRASKVPTDMTEDVVREVFLPLGLVDNKVCAVDETWSGLRVVWRKERRAALRRG